MSGHDSHSPRAKRMPREFSVTGAIGALRAERDAAKHSLPRGWKSLTAALRKSHRLHLDDDPTRWQKAMEALGVAIRIASRIERRVTTPARRRVGK